MQHLVSVYDSKAQAFTTPVFVPTVAVGLRSFTAACNQVDHDFHKFSADYSIFHLGTFDEQMGTFEIFEAPINLGLAVTFVTPIAAPTVVAIRDDITEANLEFGKEKASS